MKLSLNFVVADKDLGRRPTRLLGEIKMRGAILR